MSEHNPFRARVYNVLERSSADDPLGRTVDIMLIGLIALNVLAVVLETVPHMYERHAVLFHTFDVISVLIFTVEYFLRVWSCVEGTNDEGVPYTRLSYILAPMALIDLLAIAPFYLSFLVVMDLRFLRVLRLLRVFKLTRYSSAMTMLYNVFAEERHAFTAAMSVLLVLLIIAASGAYLAEHRVQPEEFGSIPKAMWWAMVTLTTVGYGDVTPVTVVGKIFGGLVAITGIGMAALPAGILSSGMANQLRRSRETLRETLRDMLEDGVIDAEEEEELEELRQELGLSKRVVADVILDMRRAQHARELSHCPHCGKSLGRH